MSYKATRCMITLKTGPYEDLFSDHSPHIPPDSQSNSFRPSSDSLSTPSLHHLRLGYLHAPRQDFYGFEAGLSQLANFHPAFQKSALKADTIRLTSPHELTDNVVSCCDDLPLFLSL